MEVPLLVTDFFRRAARHYPEKLALVDGTRRFRYRDLEDRIDRLSNALLDLGLRPGDRVCMLSPNSHFYFESFFATAQVTPSMRSNTACEKSSLARISHSWPFDAFSTSKASGR